MRLYKFSLIIILFILIIFEGFEKHLYANKDVLQKNKFEGEIVYDKASGGFHIFKISGSLPAKEIQLTTRDKKYYENNVEPKWSPNGKYIAYINEGSIEKNNIFIMNSDGNNKRRITSLSQGIIFNIRWDKTGNDILFTYNPNKPNENIVEKIVNIKTGIVRDVNMIEEKIKNCPEKISSADEMVLICRKWLMPGKDSFTLFQRVGGPETKTGKQQEIIFYKSSTYKKKKEFILEDAYYPIWSRNNSKFAIMIGSGLTIFDKDGNLVNRIDNLCRDEGAACLRMWSYDSKKILYSCYCGAEEIQERIYLLNLETKKSFFIAEGQHPDLYFKKR